MSTKKSRNENAKGPQDHRAEANMPMAELFGLPAKDGLSSHPRTPQPIMVTVLPVPDDPEVAALIPQVDERHVFPAAVTKAMMIGLQLSMSVYLFGPAGTGKTSLVRQACARTRRPWLRVQHTDTTEESQIVGQWTVRDGSTEFQLGPLAMAMKLGLCYVADEFDFGRPSVLSVYHAVLEGEPLVIPEAPPSIRTIEAHPNFRLVGTGNTNGTGDERGLYQGTRLQNAALYSRWAITEELAYLDAEAEIRILEGQAGLPSATAAKFVEFAKAVREGFAAQRIGLPIGPRELIACARIGKIRGGNYRAGLASGFTNRLSRVDKLAVDQLAQRVFG
ncbi:AAA family ATPase [Lichenifustis flavocetrariae]|uniref:AAA family ATPase n=1 Tax=Lichenifustis flavocetrariae TaxID=2949735 RepID=A0AA42CRS8_9HYPH|nr:AAA family ATPase [Lichenifustis flavocetrariae]MCW6512797.1 AAA family ATPase [Lichenifustis flavocetrariae]